MIPRRRTLKIILQNAFFFMVFWAGLSAVQGSEGIGRSFGPIDLGMNPEALQKAVPSEERNDMYLHLLPGEQFFLVAEAALPDGIVNVGLRFFQGRLFKISVEYDLNWFSEDEWLLLLEKEMDEYGRISIDKKQIAEGINEMARWEDDTTVYILRRQLKMRFKDKKLLPHSNVFSIYIDKSLWNERTKLESQSLF